MDGWCEARTWTNGPAFRLTAPLSGLLRCSRSAVYRGHVATLFPVVVMDANRVLPEFAAGPFFFRSADAYSAEQVAQLRGVGPATLETLFAVSPPAAIGGRVRSLWLQVEPAHGRFVDSH